MHTSHPHSLCPARLGTAHTWFLVWKYIVSVNTLAWEHDVWLGIVQTQSFGPSMGLGHFVGDNFLGMTTCDLLCSGVYFGVHACMHPVPYSHIRLHIYMYCIKAKFGAKSMPCLVVESLLVMGEWIYSLWSLKVYCRVQKCIKLIPLFIASACSSQWIKN